jgi:hypothetical protein
MFVHPPSGTISHPQDKRLPLHLNMVFYAYTDITRSPPALATQGVARLPPRGDAGWDFPFTGVGTYWHFSTPPDLWKAVYLQSALIPNSSCSAAIFHLLPLSTDFARSLCSPVMFHIIMTLTKIENYSRISNDTKFRALIYLGLVSLPPHNFAARKVGGTETGSCVIL